MKHHSLKRLAYFIVLSVATANVYPQAVTTKTPFSGILEIDLRTPAERTNKVECGVAIFELHQSGKKISGNHTFATSNCGRMNEGGEGTVKGYVMGHSAFLVVTSARNGAIVMGRADRIANSLRWLVLDEIKSGEPEEDSALILHQGTLQRSLKK